MHPSPWCWFLLLPGLLLVQSSRAQCSDCFVPQPPAAVPVSSADQNESGSDRHRAQAGDVTGVLIEGEATTSAIDGPVAPNTSISTPTAFGAAWGQVYAGLSYQERLRYSRWHDGIVAFGAGLGNPEERIGLSVAVAMLDTYTDLGEDWSVSLKLHRRLPRRSAIAVGYENIWHTSGTDGGESPYLAVSHVLITRAHPASTFGSIVLSGGLGTGRFQSESQFARRKNRIGAFGSVALRVHRSTHAIANWTGQDLNLGLSVSPLPQHLIVLTPALLDVTGRAGDGVRFGVSLSIGYDITG